MSPAPLAVMPLRPENEGLLRESIMRLVGGASIEASVKNLAEVDTYPAFLPPASTVFLPWLPGLPYTHLVSVAARLRRAGFEPVPHIAARRLPDRASADDLVSRLCGEAGVTQVLVIGGDVDRPAGPFDSAAALLQAGLLQQRGMRRIGVAGYPEGHPRIPDDRLDGVLNQKMQWATQAGLDLYVVSQFCFDGVAIERWLQRLHGAGVTLPVHVGLAGPASMRTLINYGMRCGIGASLRALRSHGVSLTRLAAQSGPESVVWHLAEAQERGALPLPLKLHFFSFGGVEKTARWMRAVSAGRVRLSGRQFELTA